MGAITHPLFGATEENNLTVHDTRLSSACLRLIAELERHLTPAGYCRWLAEATPVTWLTDAPVAEIHAGLSGKLAEGEAGR